MGYIKLHRKILEWEWYGEPKMVVLWLHILLSANYEDKTWRGKTIERGSFETSVARLSSETGLSVQEVRTCMKKLTDSKQINIQTTNQSTKVIVCNYDNYQSSSETEQQTNNKRTNTELTSGATTTKEIKEVSTSSEPNGSSEDRYKKEKPPKGGKKKDSASLDFPFSTQAFLDAWSMLIQQPKWNKKTNSALQLSLNKLSRYDEAFAVELINLAIERGWQGVVFKDTDEQYEQWKSAKEGHGKQFGPTGSTMDQYVQAIREIEQEHGLFQGSFGIDEQ